MTSPTTTRRVLASAAATALLAAAGVAATAVPADAATGYVYVSMPTWLGNCAGGWMDTPRVLTASPSTSAYASDSGDDLVYVRAGVGETTQFVGHGTCKKRINGRTYTFPASAVNVNVPVDRSGQTIWIGPDGWRKN